MPPIRQRSSLPFSSLFLAVSWLLLPLFIIPPQLPASSVATRPSDSLDLHWHNLEPGPAIDALCRDPGLVARPLLKNSVLDVEEDHTLPDGMTSRLPRPDGRLPLVAPATPISPLTQAGDPSNARLLPNPSILPQATPSSHHYTPLPRIVHDAITRRYLPVTPPLKASALTNYPWQVTVSVIYDAQGFANSAFLTEPSPLASLNETCLRCARASRLTRSPGVPHVGEIRFDCMMAVQSDSSSATRTVKETP